MRNYDCCYNEFHYNFLKSNDRNFLNKSLYLVPWSPILLNCNRTRSPFKSIQDSNKIHEQNPCYGTEKQYYKISIDNIGNCMRVYFCIFNEHKLHFYCLQQKITSS